MQVQSNTNSEETLASHIGRVEKFMQAANQVVGESKRNPTPQEAELRAKLIMEEALETISGLGVTIAVNDEELCSDCLDYLATGPCNHKEVLDGVCDLYVVSTGTLASCGLTSVFPEALRRVDENNLSKVDGAHWFREDGKLMKSPNYKPVFLDDLIE